MKLHIFDIFILLICKCTEIKEYSIIDKDEILEYFYCY